MSSDAYALIRAEQTIDRLHRQVKDRTKERDDERVVNASLRAERDALSRVADAAEAYRGAVSGEDEWVILCDALDALSTPPTTEEPSDAHS